MKKPEESLDDFSVKAVELEKVAGPPAVVRLRFGGVEVVKPLAGRDPSLSTNPATGRTYRFSWFQSALAAGGALAVMALILLSAIFIGIYDPPPGPDVAAVETADQPSEEAIPSQPEDVPAQTEEALNSDIPTTLSPTSADNAVRKVRKASKQAPGQQDQVAAHKPRRQTRRPQPVTKFVPTTLVISAENGEVKTRIEPWLTAVYKGF